MQAAQQTNCAEFSFGGCSPVMCPSLDIAFTERVIAFRAYFFVCYYISINDATKYASSFAHSPAISCPVMGNGGVIMLIR